MSHRQTPQDAASTRLEETLERYLQDIGKGRNGEGGNYRRNVKRELTHFFAWAAGDHGSDSWSGIVDQSEDRDPVFADLNERVFRSYARYLAGERGLKQNTVQTYYAYVSAWCGWCVNEGYLNVHYAQRSSAQSPLPEDTGRKPGDQQAWTADQRHELTRFVDEQAHAAIESFTTLNSDTPDADRQRARYKAMKATRDRALVYVLAYTAVRVGELLRDPDDPRRRGVRWEDVNLADGSMDVYRKKQRWDAASLPEPVIPKLSRYKKLVSPPSDRWPVFPTFDRNSLQQQITDELADRGLQKADIERLQEKYVRLFLLALAEDIRPKSLTTDGARLILRRLTDVAEIDVPHPKHGYLAPHGGRRGMGEVLVRAFGYTVAARYLDNSEEMIRERYSHIEAGELGDVATEALSEIDEL